MFGKSRVTAHCGSQSFGEDTTHWLYIGIRLKKGDPRNAWTYAKRRAEVITLLKAAGVRLFETAYCGPYDTYALSLDVYPFMPACKN